MKKLLVLAVALTLWAVPLFAGEYVTNETLKAAIGLRVIFSEPVTLTGFGDVLMTVTPDGNSSEFVFSGGVVQSWSGQWLSWEPTTAKIASYKWLAEGDSLSTTPLDELAQDFTYHVSLDNIRKEFTVVRHVERNCLPFGVDYEVEVPQTDHGYLLAWDVDKYVDTDGDGDPQNDRNFEGTVLDLIYTENYNPTVTLLIYDSDANLVASWENMVRNDFKAGETITLDSNKLLDTQGMVLPEAATVTWKQLHMKQNSFEYMTEYTADVQDPHGAVTSFSPRYAGRYVYSVQVPTTEGAKGFQVAAWVVEQPTGSARRLGIMMADVWNDAFDESGKRIEGSGDVFTDQDAIAKVRYLGAVGFDNISMCTGIALEKTLPLPVLTSEAPNSPSDSDLRMILSQIASPHLFVGSYISELADRAEDPEAWLQVSSLSRDYFESFFRQYRERILTLAGIAEEVGATGINIAANHPYVSTLAEVGEENPSKARYLAEQWRKISSDVRREFSGDVETCSLNTDLPFSRLLLGIPDDVQYLMGNYCCYGDCTYAKRITATRTAEDLRLALVDFCIAHVEPISQVLEVPVSFELWATSFINAARVYTAAGHEDSAYASWRPKFASGGYGNDILNGDVMAPFQPSFRDQVLLLETFIPVLAAMSSVDSIWLWGEYWKLMDFEDFAPQDALEIHQANNTTLQGKPGFQVARLWASIIEPNTRNLYRKLSERSTVQNQLHSLGE